MASCREGWDGNRFHRQGGGGAEYPDVPDPAGGRGAEGLAGENPDDHGRYRTHAMGRRHLRKPYDTDDGASVEDCGGDGAGDACLPGCKAVGGRPWTAD